MATVEIFTTEFCPYCDRAKRLFKSKGVAYTEHRLDMLSDEDLHRQMTRLSGQQTVPQIVINGTPIGGWDELSSLDRSGELTKMLAQPAGEPASTTR
jgi:glutaredoxin 3